MGDVSKEPANWDEALVAAGYTDGRSKAESGRPSWRRLAQAIGVHQSTLTYMRDGDRETDQATLELVAEKLQLDPLIVAEWVGRARTERVPYTPPSIANLLSSEEREAVDRIIVLLAESKKRGLRDGVAAKQEKMRGALSAGALPNEKRTRRESVSRRNIEHDKADRAQ